MHDRDHYVHLPFVKDQGGAASFQQETNKIKMKNEHPQKIISRGHL
jgi:hypothetical protein